MMIKKFGSNKKGESANLYIFENQNGMEMHVSDFGATLQALLVTLDGRFVVRHDNPPILCLAGVKTPFT